MPEALGGLEPLKILLFVAPGAAFAIFRSFGVRGYFPKLSKDDLGALAISSAVYALLMKIARIDLTSTGIFDRRPALLWLVLLLLIPAIAGLTSGLVEANDYVGRGLRKLGFRFPSPEPNAWETMFREMPAGTLLMVRLDDEAWVYGRWIKGSASSQLSESRDLFLSEIGTLSDDGEYIPYSPMRGVYVSAGAIKRIEVVENPSPSTGHGD